MTTGPKTHDAWHRRFPHYEERLARMAMHVRTDESKAAVASLRLRDKTDDWVDRGPVGG